MVKKRTPVRKINKSIKKIKNNEKSRIKKFLRKNKKLINTPYFSDVISFCRSNTLRMRNKLIQIVINGKSLELDVRAPLTKEKLKEFLDNYEQKTDELIQKTDELRSELIRRREEFFNDLISNYSKALMGLNNLRKEIDSYFIEGSKKNDGGVYVNASKNINDQIIKFWEEFSKPKSFDKTKSSIESSFNQFFKGMQSKKARKKIKLLKKPLMKKEFTSHKIACPSFISKMIFTPKLSYYKRNIKLLIRITHNMQSDLRKYLGEKGIMNKKFKPWLEKETNDYINKRIKLIKMIRYDFKKLRTKL